MLKTIASNPVALNLAGLLLVTVADGSGVTPDLLCCPTCGAAVLVLLNLAGAKAGMHGSTR